MPPFDDFVNNISRCDQLQDDPAGPDLLAEMLCLSLVLYLERSIACAIRQLANCTSSLSSLSSLYSTESTHIYFKATLDAVDISRREVQLWRDRLHVSGFRAVMLPLDAVYTAVAVVVSAARLQ